MKLSVKLAEVAKSLPEGVSSVRLLAEALDKNPSEIYSLPSLNQAQIDLIDCAVAAVKVGTPLARIFGRKVFYEHTFHISPFVFEPRPETEYLVEYVRKNYKPKRILDVCTGSGAILLSLLKIFPEAVGVGTDISPYAIENARLNARLLGVEDRADFLCGNFTDDLPDNFDLTVSNPPYVVGEVDCATYYDPPIALYENGAYEAILKNPRIKTGGHLVLEIPTYKTFSLPSHLELVSREEIGSQICMLALRMPL